MTPQGRSDLIYLEHPPTAECALAKLAGSVADWFQERFRTPTPIQCLGWTGLANHSNVLLSAPTGSGKSLAAFLPALSDFLGQQCTRSPASRQSLHGLYIAPLKALVNDAARNLQMCADEVEAFLPPGTKSPCLALRTGDTPAEERRRLQTYPPDFLMTTPESLAVLLSQPKLGAVFAGLRWVIVDEVHDFAGNKRGADLAVCLERLDRLTQKPPRRVGLSATASPLPEAARYLAGVGRPCAIATVAGASPLELVISPLEQTDTFLDALVARLEPEIRGGESTLVFTNTRRLAERLAWLLRRRLPDLDERIAVHHSSLSRERRRDVEARFKGGELRAAISSTSLELGIDIGTVDQVVFVHPPGGVVRMLQRVGRAGHGPGRSRRGLVLTSGPAELLEAAVTAASCRTEQCEPLHVANQPLDVLCQQILGMCAFRPWAADDMFDLVRRAYPFQSLCRRDFDDCLSYLLGQDSFGHPWLPARLRLVDDELSIVDQSFARLLRRNLGAILGEPGYDVTKNRLPRPGEPSPLNADDRCLVGTVDRAFGDRLEAGDRFLLDGQCLEYRRREGNALVVNETSGRPSPPCWGGDGWPLSKELARRLFQLRVQATEALRDGPAVLALLLRRDYGLGPAATNALVGYFQHQEMVSEVPDASALLIEAVVNGTGSDFYVHTPLNRPANDVLARVAVHRLGRDHGRAAASIVADLGFALFVEGEVEDFAGLLRSLLNLEDFDGDLEAHFSGSDAVRERFRRVAQTGFMVPRQPLGGRRRVGGAFWSNHQLFDRVRAHDSDFVLLRQALREVRTELCDDEAAKAFAEELPGLQVRCRYLARPSPFAEGWTQADAGCESTVETPAEALRRLHHLLTGGVPADAGVA